MVLYVALSARVIRRKRSLTLKAVVSGMHRPSTAAWSYSLSPNASAAIVVTVPDTPMMLRARAASTCSKASSMCSSTSLRADLI